MSDLVRVDLDVLPREPMYRPLGRQAYYARTVPVVAIGCMVVGVLSVALDPLVIIAWAATVAGWAVLRRRAMVRVLRANDEGLARLASGDIEAAAATFDALCERSRRLPAVHCLLVHNRAVAHLEAGQPDRAYALLSAVVHAGWVGPRGALSLYHPQVLARMAMAQALRGEVDDAVLWRARAHAAISDAKRPSLLLVDLLVEGRREAWDTMAGLVAERSTTAENLMTARPMRAVRALEAFALEHLRGDQYREASRETERRRALDAARVGPPGQFDHLAVQWPELRAFLDRHGL